MTDEPTDALSQRNLWAPWRMDYIRGIKDRDRCFLCDHRDAPDDDRENLVLWRSPRCLVVMNRYPYTAGHSLVAPLQHVPSLAELDGQALREMMELTRDLQTVLSSAIGCQGFNVGINIGKCAGAGLPGHLHLHVVPRWVGDTNFMPLFGNVQVVPRALDDLYDHLRATADDEGLPKTSP